MVIFPGVASGGCTCPYTTLSLVLVPFDGGVPSFSMLLSNLLVKRLIVQIESYLQVQMQRVCQRSFESFSRNLEIKELLRTKRRYDEKRFRTIEVELRAPSVLSKRHRWFRCERGPAPIPSLRPVSTALERHSISLVTGQRSARYAT